MSSPTAEQIQDELALDLEAECAAVEAAGFPLVARGWAYAADVLAGRIDVCEEVHLAAARAWRDLVRGRRGEDAFPYTFNPARAERVLRACGKFREYKGPRAGRRLVLSAWQLFAYGQVFGWVDRLGARRFRYCLIYAPRGNGKTTMVAPLMLYMLVLDGEGGAEVYSAAVTREQARIAFDAARAMARGDGHFCTHFGVDVRSHTIAHPPSGGVVRPLSKQAQSLDGLNVHLAVIDELAQHPSRDVHDVLLTAMGKRRQPLLAAITTCGSNTTGVGHQQWRYAQRVLRGQAVDETFFGLIYTVALEDDWRDPATWRRANPNWGVSVMPDAIASMAARAVAMPSEQAAFKTKHLNIWAESESAWMNMARWHAGAIPDLEESEFHNTECILGLDLASKRDLAAKVRVHWREEADGRRHFYVFARSWLPAEVVATSDHAALKGWVADGWLTESPGNTSDFDAIEEAVFEDARRFDVLDVAYDSWQATQLASHLTDAGVPCIEVQQTTRNLSIAMKEIEALVHEGRLHHNGDPVLAWCIGCVMVWRDRNDNIFPRKDVSAGHKIDVAVALIMAFARYIAIQAEGRKEPQLLFV